MNLELVYPGATGIAVLGLLGGLLVGRLGRGRLQREGDGLRARVARLENQTKDQGRMVARLRSQQGTVASLALSLPGVVRELNRSDLDVRSVPRLVIHLAEAIFQPGVVLFYALRATRSENGKQGELQLLCHQGLKIEPGSVERISVGDGKLGWVAQNRLDMLKEDWLNLARTDGLTVRDNHPGLDLDVMGPLVHHSINGEQVLGVLALGALGARPRNEKLMFQMVTNLGSLALVNAMNVSRLREQANHDGLTGLLNKRFFMHELAQLVVTAEREAQPLSLFIFDIDHFKTYNDTNGHPAGDELLRALSALLRDNVRPGDLCCRYGGEEFVVAMPQTDREHAEQAAERIRSAIEECEFEHQGTQPGGILTISGGVAVFPHNGASADELTEQADRALYRSKRSGRNRVTVARSFGIGEFREQSDIDLPPSASARNADNG